MESKDSNGNVSLVTCSIIMHLPPGEGERAIQLLLTIVGLTQAKHGCRAALVAREAAEDNRIRYTEEWYSKEAFERHIASDEFRRVLVAMDMCCEEPDVIVGNLSGRRGIAFLQELREKQGRDTG